MGVNTLFLDTVWGPLGGPPYGELRAFKKGAENVQTFKKNTVDAMTTALALGVVDRMDVYFGVIPRTSMRGRAQDTIDVTDVLWADFDAKNFKGKTGAGSAFSELSHMRMTPHIIVDSGNGYHAYWLLDQDYPFEQAQKVMKGIEYVHHSDHCSDQARILRVPGTLNFKQQPPHPVRLVRFDTFSPRYTLDMFNEYQYRASTPIRQVYGPSESTGEWTPSTDAAPKFGEGERNNGLARLAGIMIAKGLSHDDIINDLLMENDLRCEPPLEADEVFAIAKSVERYRS